MTAPGTIDVVGRSHLPPNAPEFPFEVPVSQPSLTPGGQPLKGGSNRDVGSLALFLVSNWFVNGETVLIDGGVSFCCHFLALLGSDKFRIVDTPEAPFVLLRKRRLGTRRERESCNCSSGIHTIHILYMQPHRT